MTNEQTELLECLDQLAKHIRAGETLNPNNAASIVEDAAAALRAHEPEAERCDSLSPNHGTWQCEKPTGHQGPHEVHGDTAYISWPPDRSFVPKARAYGPGMTPHADDCECLVCKPQQFCPHCGKSEPHTHRVPGVAEPVVFPHS